MPLIDARDVANVVVKALTEPGHEAALARVDRDGERIHCIIVYKLYVHPLHLGASVRDKLRAGGRRERPEEWRCTG